LTDPATEQILTASPEWVGTLPDDLKADPTLVKYQNVEALARGHLETKKLASSKLQRSPAKARPPRIGARYGTRSAAPRAPTSTSSS
jgi:hypothetical protein